MEYMTSNYTSRYKTYPGNNKPNIIFTIANYSLLPKLLSALFLIIVCRTYLLFIIGLECKLKNNNRSKAMQHACKVSGLPNHADQSIETVTTLGMGNSVGYISLNWDRSKFLDAKPSIDEAIPNWESYGIAPFALCQREGSGYTHTFALALDGTKFKNGEALGFILLKNNQPPASLVKYLATKDIPWPDQLCAYIYIKDCLILPGLIGQDVLQYTHHFDSFTDLNSYLHIYCYIKKGPHYCFIPLKNRVAEARTVYSIPMPFPKAMPSIEADQVSLDSGIDSESEEKAELDEGGPLLTAKSLLEANKPLDGLAICNHSRVRLKQQLSLSDELIAAGYDPACSKMTHNSSLSRASQDPEAIQMKEKYLNSINNNVKIFENIYIYVTESIKKYKTATLNKIKKIEISQNWGNKIESALSLALKAITSLKSSLVLEKEYQLKIEDKRPTNLSDQLRAVIQILENLEAVVCEEYVEVLSAELLLNQVIESLEKIDDLLFDIRKLDRLEATNDINRSIKQLLTRDSMQFKKAEKIIKQLEEMEDEQLSTIHFFRKKISEIQDTLVAIQKDLVASIRIPLEEVVIAKTDVSNLKRALKLEVSIIAGRVKNSSHIIEEIITDLELQKDDIQKILNEPNLEPRKLEIAKNIEEAVNKALNLENKLQTEIPLKAKEITNQAKKLIDLCYDSVHEEA